MQNVDNVEAEYMRAKIAKNIFSDKIANAIIKKNGGVFFQLPIRTLIALSESPGLNKLSDEELMESKNIKKSHKIEMFMICWMDISMIDRFLELPQGINGIGIVYRNQDGSERAEVIDLETRKRTSMKSFVEQFRTIEQIKNNFSVVKDYNEKVDSALDKACATNDSELGMAIACEGIIKNLDKRYLLNENMEKMVQNMTKRIEYLKMINKNK